MSWGCAGEQLLHRNVQRFRGRLVFKTHRLCVSLNSRLESNKDEGRVSGSGTALPDGDAARGLGFGALRLIDPRG